MRKQQNYSFYLALATFLLVLTGCDTKSRSTLTKVEISILGTYKCLVNTGLYDVKGITSIVKYFEEESIKHQQMDSRSYERIADALKKGVSKEEYEAMENNIKNKSCHEIATAWIAIQLPSDMSAEIIVLLAENGWFENKKSSKTLLELTKGLNFAPKYKTMITGIKNE